MDKKCQVEGCDNLVENASAPDPRRSLCAEHIVEYSFINQKERESEDE